jgi:hypothetical protein
MAVLLLLFLPVSLSGNIAGGEFVRENEGSGKVTRDEVFWRSTSTHFPLGVERSP